MPEIVIGRGSVISRETQVSEKKGGLQTTTFSIVKEFYPKEEPRGFGFLKNRNIPAGPAQFMVQVLPIGRIVGSEVAPVVDGIGEVIDGYASNLQGFVRLPAIEESDDGITTTQVIDPDLLPPEIAQNYKQITFPRRRKEDGQS